MIFGGVERQQANIISDVIASNASLVLIRIAIVGVSH